MVEERLFACCNSFVCLFVSVSLWAAAIGLSLVQIHCKWSHHCWPLLPQQWHQPSVHWLLTVRPPSSCNPTDNSLIRQTVSEGNWWTCVRGLLIPTDVYFGEESKSQGRIWTTVTPCLKINLRQQRLLRLMTMIRAAHWGALRSPAALQVSLRTPATSHSPKTWLLSYLVSLKCP